MLKYSIYSFNSLKEIFSLIFICCIVQFSKSQCTTTINTFPYNEDFESAPVWTIGGTNSDWAWGSPAHPTINSAGGGTNSWCVGGLNGSFYSLSEQAWIMSPCFDFSNLNYPWINFKIYWECERQWDGMALQYTLDGGVTWINVGAYGDTEDCLNSNWYNYDNITWLNTLAVKHGWSGRVGATSGSCTGGFGSNGWVTAKHCMSNLAHEPNVQFRFIFGSGTTCNAFDGIAIDDVYIGEAPANDANFNFSCTSGTTVNFTNLSLQCPTNYSWNFGDPTSGNANNSFLENPTHTFPGAGVYNVSLIASGPCNAPDTIVLPVAITTSFLNPISPICSGEVISLPLTSTNGVSGTWSPVINNSATTTYTFTPSVGQCSSIEQQTVVVFPNPIVDAGDSLSICTSHSATFTATGAQQYFWNNNVQNGIPFLPGSSQYYYLTGVDNNGCSASDSVYLTIVASPNASFISSTNSGQIQLNVNFTNNSTNANTFFWDFGNGLDSTITNLNNVNTLFTNPGDYPVWLFASNGICVDSVSSIIHVLPIFPPEISVPNVFSPNADNTNENWNIETSNIDSLHFIILNRWGEIMTEVDNLTQGWNGKTPKGNDAKDGVYFYSYSAVAKNGEQLKGQGFITLVR